MEISTVRELLTISGILIGAVMTICGIYYTVKSTKGKTIYLSEQVAALEKRVSAAESDISLLKHVDVSLKDSMAEIKQDLREIKTMLMQQGAKCN